MCIHMLLLCYMVHAYIAVSLLIIIYKYLARCWCILQKWVKAFRDQEYRAAVDTNNGAEAHHKTLKYSYLPKQRSMTLSSIAKLLVEDFLPESRKIYLFKNYKQSSLYRSYKELVPPYLKERPRSVILHCLHR